MADEELDGPLEKSIKDELDALDEAAGRTASIASLLPWLDEKRDEAQAKLFAVKNAPKDFVSEVSPQLIVSQRRDTDRARSLSQLIPPVDPDRIRYSASGTSSSDFSQVIIRTFPDPAQRPSWVPPVVHQFSAVADRKAKLESLPRAMELLKEGLGRTFTAADNSIAQAKAHVIQPHQAASSMRNVIQDTWGALLERARLPESGISQEKHYELKKPSHRAAASAALVAPALQASYAHSLEDLYTIYRDLSSLSKKTGTPPLKLLHDLRIRWILGLDAVITSLPPTP